jgi:NAD(P)-dependent dehydrogenase (short-subunit alcohol dehydrogenase family)
VPRTQAAFQTIGFDAAKHSLRVLPLELSDLRSTKAFARLTLEKLGGGGVDYLLLNAAVSDGSETAGSHGSKWSKALVVNHLAQHYLVHLLRDKLVESRSRLVFVSSGAVRQVEDPGVLEEDVKDGSGVPGFKLYSETKFIQLLGAHWWRRELTGKCVVVAVSPGLIPGTGLGRGMGMDLPKSMPDAKSVPEGEFPSLERIVLGGC